MPGSSTTPGHPGACDGAPEHVAFRRLDNVGTRDINSVAAQWLAFNGQWGPTVTEPIDEPPSSLPSGARGELLTLAQAGSTLGLLSSYTSENGPNGPKAVNWDISKEPAE